MPRENRLFERVVFAVGWIFFGLLNAGAVRADTSSTDPAVAQPAPLLPLEDFFRKPEKTAFAISPDGSYLAWLAPWQNRLNIHVQPIAGGQVKRLTDLTDRDIAHFVWEGNDQLVFSRDSGGDENFHLFAVRRDGGPVRDLTPYPGVRTDIVDELEDIDDRLLIAMNKRDAKVFDVYRLTPSTGAIQLITTNPGTIIDWLTDHDGKLRAAVAQNGINMTLLYRDSEKDAFRSVLTTDFRTSVIPLAFTFDNRRLIVSSNMGRDKMAIVELDPRAGKEMRVLYQHPEVDVVQVMLSRHRKLIEGVAYVTDRLHYAFFDPRREHIQKILETQLDGQDIAIVDRSKDESCLLVNADSDRNPGSYYVYEAGTEKLTRRANIAPWIKPGYLAEMKPIQYTSRDGKTIHGYLTLPVGLAPRRLPAVVNPHGGPEYRDSWGYSAQVQFLANRGYAVLQMNFRGSSGYGRSFWEAGFKQWGRGAMQHDITDGVRWLIEQDIADPKRIAIYGGSYGGYAALAGLTFTPELYAAGISYVGPSNLFTLFASIPPYWELGRQEWYAKVGDPEKDKELLTSISPLFHVDQIKAPLFVVQGANDPRVKKAESDQIVSALRKRGIEVPYMVKANEGHGFRNQENQFDFYRAMEAFLASSLQGRSTTDAAVLKPLEMAH